MISAWLNTGVIETVGWTLVHFLWQGLALALLLWVFVAFSRSSRVRYIAALLTLVLMTSAPVFTFLRLANTPQEPCSHSTWKEVLADLQIVASTGAGVSIPAATHSLLAINWLEYFVWAWLAGVGIFALRAFGGWMLIQRVLREKREPLSIELRQRCAELQQRIGLHRMIRYFHSRLVDAPAVIGFFRPVVLLPMSALTGLSPQQLEAVITHELAHIKRLDCFVNLFQIAAETLLFYHPAVWWVSRVIRIERENCCDDIAVAVCGDPSEYARALTAMESWRATPSILLAANSGALKSRVGRLLGLNMIVRSVPQTGLLVTICFCMAGALIAGTTFDRAWSTFTGNASVSSREAQPTVVSTASDIPTPPAAPQVSGPATTPTPACYRAAARVRPVSQNAAVQAEPDKADLRAELAAPDQAADDDDDNDPPSQSVKAGDTGSSYITGLEAAGLKGMTVDQIIELKSQGVTPEYIREVRAAGVNPSIGELIAMKTQCVSPDYIRKVRSNWKDAKLGEIIAMKVQDVNPDQAGEFQRQLGLSNMSLGQLITFKIQDVTPDYVRGLREAGFTNLSAGQIIAAKVQGVTPEFVRKVHEHGFNNLTLQQLIGLKAAGVF